MTEILSIRRKTLSNQSINQSINICEINRSFTDLAFQEGMQKYYTTQVILGTGVYISERKYLLDYHSCS